MKLHELGPSRGRSRVKKRIGRGNGSGSGGTSGRGHKGYNSRSGGGVRPGFEGGQMPLYRRIPKRGFRNIFKKNYQIVNVGDLVRFNSGDFVDKKSLVLSGLIKNSRLGVKLLGNGDINIPLRVNLEKVSSNAKAKIEAVGGKIEEKF